MVLLSCGFILRIIKLIKMNRREDLQQFFISANTSQDRHNFDFEKFTDEYLIRNPKVVKENCNLQNVSNGKILIPDALFYVLCFMSGCLIGTLWLLI